MFLKSFLRNWVPPAILAFASRLQRVCRAIGALRRSKHESYYPQADKKSRWEILRELAVTAWKWGRFDAIEKTYFVFGLDCKGRSVNEYVFLEEFGRIKDYLNSLSFDYNTILNNKVVTNLLFRTWNLPVPGLLGSIEKQEGLLYLVSKDNVCLLKEHLEEHAMESFCKPLAGSGGHGAFRLESRNGRIMVDSSATSWTDLEPRFVPPMTLEELVKQHELLSALHPQSVNTLRIMTIKKSIGEAEVLDAFLRVGCGEKRVDNWASGGIVVPVSPDGRLTSVGYMKPGFGLAVDRHPDTHIVFDGFNIPFFRESVGLAKRAHRHMGGMHSIGWDIAITSQGPVIIEANGDWDVLLPQVSHGMRKEFEALFVRRYDELRRAGRLQTA